MVLKMISVIIPVYNVEKYLNRCLQSVLNQTYTEFEVILIDDGSTDKSGEICDSVLSDKRCKVIHQNNQGVSSARNRGLAVSRGEYILFVDPDDWLDQEMLEKLFSGIGDADLAMCFHYVANETSPGEYEFVEHRYFDSKEPFKTENVYYDIFMKSGPLWNKLIKRDAIGEMLFRTDMTYGEDTVFLAKCLEHVRTAVIVPECLYYYQRVRKGNVVSSAIDNRSLEYLENIKVVFDCCKSANCPSVGIKRIVSSVREVLLKIQFTVEDIFSKKQYIKACNRLIRYPSMSDYFVFFTDKRIPFSNKKEAIVLFDCFLFMLCHSIKVRKLFRGKHKS